MSDASDVKALLASAHPGAVVEVTGVRRLSAGASRRTLLVDGLVDARPVTEVVQLGEGPEDPGRPGVSVQGELMVRAAALGVPVPPVLHAADGALVTAAVAGETLARRVLRQEEYAGARTRLAADCGRALAAIQRVDPSGLGLVEVDPLDGLRRDMDELGEPRALFELTLRWLTEHRPASTGRVLVHGDFRLGNLVVGPDGLRAVLDWELAHIGDPMEDLGWVCAVPWRFGSDLPVAGVGRRDDLYEAYEAAGGGPVDPALARWWEVRAALLWGLICQRQARRHLSGTTRSMELAAIGRRTCETEWDLLGLLWPDARDAAAAAATGAPGLAPAGWPSGADSTGGLHGRPSAVELVDALEGWLAGEVAPVLGPDHAFHLRVAGNVLATIRRELALAPSQEAGATDRLAALDVADEAALARAVRDGDTGDGRPGLLDTVAWLAAERLRVANPRYLARPLPA